MDRRIVYPNGQEQDADILATNQFGMIALGRFMELVLGTSTTIGGLTCIPTTPASMAVQVGPGSIYSPQNLEATSYGTLPADTAHTLMKQGTNLDSTTLTLTAPTTSGNSIVYLIQAAYSETDTIPQTIPFRDSVTGVVTQQTVPTARKAVCTVGAKAGISATTGTAIAPSPDAGYIGLYTVILAQGQTTITSGNITRVASVRSVDTKLPDIVASIKTGSVLAFSTGATTVGATANNNFGLNAAVGSAALASFIIPFNYRISNFYGYAASTPTMGTRAYTVIINGNATSIAATATGTASTASDLTHSVTGNAGDQISVQIVTNGSDALAHKASLMIQQIS